MSSAVGAVSATQSAFEAGELMLERGLRWLPVVDNGRPIGVIARSDLVRASLRDDKELRQDVLIRLLSRSAVVEFEAVAVCVRDGVVTLSGELSDRAEIDLARQSAEEVPGVQAVRDRLVVRPVGG
jgi:CBS domain-containing protein